MANTNSNFIRDQVSSSRLHRPSDRRTNRAIHAARKVRAQAEQERKEAARTVQMLKLEKRAEELQVQSKGAVRLVDRLKFAGKRMLGKLTGRVAMGVAITMLMLSVHAYAQTATTPSAKPGVATTKPNTTSYVTVDNGSYALCIDGAPGNDRLYNTLILMLDNLLEVDASRDATKDKKLPDNVEALYAVARAAYLQAKSSWGDVQLAQRLGVEVGKVQSTWERDVWFAVDAVGDLQRARGIKP